MKRIGILALLLLAPVAAPASQQGTMVVKRWQVMDKCTHQAQQAFPDFNAESNAKRDAKLKECLAGNNLPGREPLSPAKP